MLGYPLWQSLQTHMPRVGYWSCVASFILVAVWVGLMAPLEGGTRAGFEAHPVLFRLMFSACVGFTLLQVPIVLALAVRAAEACPTRAVLGAAITLVYVPLNAGT